MPATAIDIVNNWFDPPIWETSACYGTLYKNHPVMSRVVFMPLSLIRGVVKVFLFPLVTVVGAVVLPLFGIFKSLWHSKCVGWEEIKAGGICLLGAGLFITYALLSAYHIPLIASSSIFMGAILISTSVHIYRSSDAYKCEEDPQRVQDDIFRVQIPNDPPAAGKKEDKAG